MNHRAESGTNVQDHDRLSALFATELLDSAPEHSFDRLTRLACKLLKVPIALVSLVDGERQFFKSQQGLPKKVAAARGTPLSHSFCKFVVETEQLLVIGDVPGDPLVCDNPVLQDVAIKAYAGVPITDGEGRVLGSLCAIDTVQRRWSEDELDTLVELAGAVETEIKLRIELQRHARTRSDLEAAQREKAREASKAALVDILKGLIRDTPQAIAMLDRDMRYVVHSQRWVEDYGLEQSDLIGLSHYDIFPDVPPRFREEHQRVLAGERIKNPDDQFVRTSGHLEHVARELVPWYGPDGKVGGLFILSDVLTEERRTNQQLQQTLEQVRANKQKLRETIAALETAQKLARLERWTWNLEKGWLYRHATGQTSHLEAVQGKERSALFPDNLSVERFLGLIDRTDRARLEERFVTASKSPTAFSEAFLMNFEHGKTIYCSLQAVPVQDERGVLLHYVGTIQDLTRIHELESKLFQTQKLEALGQMASGVAHDFNNILTVVQGYADMMRRKIESGSPLETDLTRIRQGTEQGSRLVKQLLMFARKKKPGTELLDLHHLIRESDEMLQCYLKARINLRMDLGAENCTLLFNRSKLEQLLFNFVGNAGDAIEKAGRVVITTSNEVLRFEQLCSDGGRLNPGEYLRLTISDTGSGIDAEMRQKIFEPLFTTKGEGKGTGLGLSVCASVVKEAHGAIDLESEPGQGSSFHIYLPVAGAIDLE